MVDPDESRARVVVAADAPLGRSEPTRRYALAFGDRTPAFAGLARDEADRLAVLIPRLDLPEPERLLVRVTLPVLLSDGAGPHLLAHSGELVLALADHPLLEGLRVAMGEARPGHLIGVVARCGEPSLWSWRAVARVAPADRLEALELLDAAANDRDLEQWQARELRRAAAGGSV